MKYLKLLIALLLPLTMVGCSDDDDINSGNATVGFEKSEMTVKESTSRLTVPIVVTGDHNGLIEVVVKVKDATGTQVENDKTVILTSESIRIPAGIEENVEAEIYLTVSTKEDNFDRSFILEIAEANGATVSTSTCKVNIDEVVDPYEKLAGEWTFKAQSADGSKSYQFPVRVETNEKGDGYNCYGFNNDEEVEWRMLYSLTSGLQVVSNEPILSDVNFGLGFIANVRFVMIDGGKLYLSNIPGMWNEDFTEITFDTGMGGGIFNGDSYSGYVWFQFFNCKMEK